MHDEVELTRGYLLHRLSHEDERIRTLLTAHTTNKHYIEGPQIFTLSILNMLGVSGKTNERRIDYFRCRNMVYIFHPAFELRRNHMMKLNPFVVSQRLAREATTEHIFHNVQ